MSGKPMIYNWQWDAISPPDAIWPYLADTDRINETLGLPKFDYEHEPLENGGSRMYSSGTQIVVPLLYEDLPFDWVHEQWFTNRRVFKKGPFTILDVELRLEPNESGGTLVYYNVIGTPAIWWWRPLISYQIGWDMQRKLSAAVQQIDQFAQQQSKRPYKLRNTKPVSGADARIKRFRNQLLAEGYNETWLDLLFTTVLDEPDSNAARLRPFELADKWGAPRIPVLEMFLSAARAGMLNLRWDLMCVLCRGAKVTVDSLDEVRRGVHCPSCNIDFDVNFSQNVELTFTPNSQIRQIFDSRYCAGGPMLTPHILVHQRIGANETRSIGVNLPASQYQIRTQKPGVFENIAWSGKGTLQVKIDAEKLVAQVDETGEPVIKLHNRTNSEQRLFVEQAAWSLNAVTADRVTTLQHFRDLFGDEVLSSDEEIGVQSLTILFTDLVGSTAMYNRQGDAQSFGVVRQQFAFLQKIVRENMGTIVKTIGDAIMAAFYDPADGVRAALLIQEEIAQFNATHSGESLALKIGMHMGPSIAVNLSGRLDYFGTSINLAARLEGLSKGGEVVISSALRDDPLVDALLIEKKVELLPFSTSIKGFDEDYKLYRLRLPA